MLADHLQTLTVQVKALYCIIGAGEEDSALIRLPSHSQDGHLDISVDKLLYMGWLRVQPIILVVDSEHEQVTIERRCSQHAVADHLVWIVVGRSIGTWKWAELELRDGLRELYLALHRHIKLVDDVAKILTGLLALYHSAKLLLWLTTADASEQR